MQAIQTAVENIEAELVSIKADLEAAADRMKYSQARDIRKSAQTIKVLVQDIRKLALAEIKK